MRPQLRTSIIVTLLTFALYLITSGPTFGFIDEGELAAVAATGGIAHPTGYPTFTILGGLVTLLPFRDISELLVLASLLTALGAGFSVLAFDRLLRYVRGEEEGPGRGESEVGSGRGWRDGLLRGRGAIAAAGGLALGLSGIWWRQGTGFEVYSLHAFFLPLLLLLFIRWIEFEEGRGEEFSGVGFSKEGSLFALVLGLSFTNHMTTVLLAPAFLFFFAIRIGVGLPDLRRLVGLIPAFIVGLLPYLWLPIRAAADPRFNWSNPETLWAIGRHLTGAQYGVWIFTNPDSFALQSRFIFPEIAREFLWVGILLALVGIWHLFSARTWASAAAIAIVGVVVALLVDDSGDSVSFVVSSVVLLAGGLISLPLFSRSGRRGEKRKKGSEGGGGRPMSIGVMLLLLIITTFLYAGGYDILDIESYYLASILGIAGLVVFGLDWLVDQFGGKVVMPGTAILLPGMLMMNWGASDRSDLWLVEDAAQNMLQTAPKNGVIISGLWDFWLSGSWYLQGAEGVRPDVAVIDHNLLRYTWYLDQLQAAHPELMGRVAEEVAAFREQGYLFEHDLPYDPGTIDRRYVEMVDAIISESLELDRPVILTFDVNERGGAGFRYGAAWAPPNRRVPYGLGYLINPGGEYLPQEFPDWRFRKSSRGPDGYEAALYRWYATAARDRAQYEALHGNDSLARAYVAYGLTFDPEWEWNPDTQAPMAQGMVGRINEMVGTFAEMRSLLAR